LKNDSANHHLCCIHIGNMIWMRDTLGILKISRWICNFPNYRNHILCFIQNLATICTAVFHYMRAIDLGMGSDSVGSTWLCEPNWAGASRADRTGSNNRFRTEFRTEPTQTDSKTGSNIFFCYKINKISCTYSNKTVIKVIIATINKKIDCYLQMFVIYNCSLFTIVIHNCYWYC
jgi:hypothetical protein